MMMTDSIKKIFLAGIGAVAATADKAQEMVDEFVKKGEITVDQGKELMNEFKEKAAKSNFTFVKKEDFEALKARVTELENKINETNNEQQ